MGVRERKLMEIIKKASNKNATTNVRQWMPESDWQAYESDCWAFFLKQVNKQRPRVVALLARHNRRDLFREGRLGHRRRTEREFMHNFEFNDGESYSRWGIHDRHPYSIAKGALIKSKLRSGILKQIRELYSCYDPPANAFNVNISTAK